MDEIIMIIFQQDLNSETYRDMHRELIGLNLN